MRAIWGHSYDAAREARAASIIKHRQGSPAVGGLQPEEQCPGGFDVSLGSGIRSFAQCYRGGIVCAENELQRLGKPPHGSAVDCGFVHGRTLPVPPQERPVWRLSK